MKGIKIGGYAITQEWLGDCDQIWFVFRDQGAMHITKVMGGVYLHVQTCAHADVPISVSRKPLDGLR